jgi:hypothetical protein
MQRIQASPAAAPTSMSPAGPSNHTEYEKQQDCAYKRVDNQGSDPRTEMHV